MNKKNNFGMWSTKYNDYLYVEVDSENKILKIRGEDPETGHKSKILISEIEKEYLIRQFKKNPQFKNFKLEFLDILEDKSHKFKKVWAVPCQGMEKAYKLTTARKEYECDNCSTKIGTGEKYYRTYIPPYQLSEIPNNIKIIKKTCQECFQSGIEELKNREQTPPLYNTNIKDVIQMPDDKNEENSIDNPNTGQTGGLKLIPEDEVKKKHSASKIYQTKEWKENRDKLINENSVCAWCGEKEKLAPHHFKNKIPGHGQFLFIKYLESEYNKQIPCPEFIKFMEDKDDFIKLKEEFIKNLPYIKHLENIIPWFKEQISSKGKIYIKPSDIQKELCYEFENNDPIADRNLKYLLWRSHIIIENAIHNDGSELLVFRNKASKDKVPVHYTKIHEFNDRYKRITKKYKSEFGKLNYQQFKEDKVLQDIIEKEYNQIIERYKSINPEDVIILCNRCHYAAENGKNLCPICKKNYKSIKYDKCLECKKKSGIREKTAMRNCISCRRDPECYGKGFCPAFDDDEAEAWIDNFNAATPERQHEMLAIQDFEQDREYGLVNCSSYEQFKHCKEARERLDPECKECERGMVNE